MEKWSKVKKTICEGNMIFLYGWQILVAFVMPQSGGQREQILAS